MANYDLNEEIEINKKLLSLFKHVKEMIDEFEQLLVHEMEDYVIRDKAKKIEKYLLAIRKILGKDKIFLKKNVKIFLDNNPEHKKEIKELPRMASDQIDETNDLIKSINVLLKNPNEKIIDRISSLINNIDWLIKEEINTLSGLEED